MNIHIQQPISPTDYDKDYQGRKLFAAKKRKKSRLNRDKNCKICGLNSNILQKHYI